MIRGQVGMQFKIGGEYDREVESDSLCMMLNRPAILKVNVVRFGCGWKPVDLGSKLRWLNHVHSYRRRERESSGGFNVKSIGARRLGS